MENNDFTKKLIEEKEFRRQRAKWEFELRLNEFIDKFKSKEETKVTLSKRDFIEVLAEVVAKNINKI